MPVTRRAKLKSSLMVATQASRAKAKGGVNKKDSPAKRDSTTMATVASVAAASVVAPLEETPTKAFTTAAAGTGAPAFTTPATAAAAGAMDSQTGATSAHALEAVVGIGINTTIEAPPSGSGVSKSLDKLTTVDAPSARDESIKALDSGAKTLADTKPASREPVAVAKSAKGTHAVNASSTENTKATAVATTPDSITRDHSVDPPDSGDAATVPTTDAHNTTAEGYAEPTSIANSNGVVNPLEEATDALAAEALDDTEGAFPTVADAIEAGLDSVAPRGVDLDPMTSSGFDSYASSVDSTGRKPGFHTTSKASLARHIQAPAEPSTVSQSGIDVTLSTVDATADRAGFASSGGGPGVHATALESNSRPPAVSTLRREPHPFLTTENANAYAQDPRMEGLTIDIDDEYPSEIQRLPWNVFLTPRERGPQLAG